jgi:small subunit ribosomal protein S11
MSDTPDSKVPESAAPAVEKKAKAPKTPKTKATDTAPVAAEASAPKAEATASETPSSASEAPARKVETAADLLATDVGDLKIRRAKGSKNITSGVCHVLATFNNTMVTFTDKAGNVIARSSSGKCGFKGAKKSTAYAAQVVCQDAAKVALSHGLKDVEVRLKGPGMGRDSAVRALQTLGIAVSSLIDVTPIPHNGCRPRKHRRV